MGSSSAGDYSHEKLPRMEVLRVASSALVDPRCVVRYLRLVHDQDDAIRLKDTTVARVERALAKCGRRDLIAPTSHYAAVRFSNGSPK